MNYKPHSLCAAAHAALNGEPLNEASNFSRLPSHVIGNELHVAMRNLTSIQSALKSGHDFDDKAFGKAIEALKKIRKSAKTFNDGDDVPLSFEYKSK